MLWLELIELALFVREDDDTTEEDICDAEDEEPPAAPMERLPVVDTLATLLTEEGVCWAWLR